MANPKQLSEPEFLFGIEQSSPEWFEARRGIPTASEFATILSDESKAKGKTPGRKRYLYRLAGEIIQGDVNESYTNFAMQRGKEMEADALDYYARTKFADMERVGFVRRKLPSGRYFGCSPDSLVSRSRVVQVKTMRPDLMIEHREKGTERSLIDEHKAQVQGELLATGYAEADLLIFYSKMPFSFCFRIARDEAYIETLTAEIIRFDAELNAVVERSRK